jgi:MoxR-like ATPase
MHAQTAPVQPQPGNDVQSAFQRLRDDINQRILGQEALVDRLLIALLGDGHLLVEGAPGLAKTTAIKELAARTEGNFHRVQFTPDLLPGDLTGTEVFRPQQGSFEFQRGPLFHNLVLADEINRAPAKVQSALLEAMGERQITVGKHTYDLPRLFLVMATQNPIDHEGTYPLPEAQMDRFLMQVNIGYPDADKEHSILEIARREAAAEQPAPRQILTERQVFSARAAVAGLHMAKPVEDYLVQIVLASRDPGPYGTDLARWIEYGASPRGSIALDRCARAHAWLNGRDYVSPEDVQALVFDVLRHRILVTYEAEADGVDSERVIAELLARVPVA